MSRICGVPDHFGQGTICKWPIMDVFIYAKGFLGQVDVEQATVEAIGYWNEVCGINLQMSSNPKTSHIRVNFGVIDGPSGTLAISELPCGMIASALRQMQQTYDTSEGWVIAENPPANKIDAVRVFAHEIGHAIGISHIDAGNLLAPIYSQTIRRPCAGDIKEAVVRYGLRPSTPVPTPTPTLGPVKDLIIVDDFGNRWSPTNWKKL